MGAGKSKPKEPGQRSMSLDGTIGTGSDSGHFHHLGPVQQTQTPNRSPAVGTGRRGHQGQHQQAPTNTPELALFGGVSMGTITSPQRGPLSGENSGKDPGSFRVLFLFLFFLSLCMNTEKKHFVGFLSKGGFEGWAKMSLLEKLRHPPMTNQGSFSFINY